MSDSVTFESLNLDSRILQAVTDLGYETPSAIQAESIPPLLEGRDILGKLRQVQVKQLHLLCLYYHVLILVNHHRKF